jgi:hypothetical protein
MDELIRQITSRTGISDAQAREAITIVLNFAKERMPATLAGQIDNIIGGNPSQGQSVQEHLNQLGGLFNKRD